MNISVLKRGLFFGLLSLLVLSACDDDDDNNPSPVNPTQVRSNVQDGNWRITRFIDSGVDETSDFAGYIFTFGSTGELTATNGTNNFSGTWQVDDDDDSNDVDLIISFNLTNDFEELNEDWDIISQSTTRIELVDRDDNNDDDFLTFEKI